MANSRCVKRLLTLLILAVPFQWSASAEGSDAQWGHEFSAPANSRFLAMTFNAEGKVVYAGSALPSDTIGAPPASLIQLEGRERISLLPSAGITIYALATNGTDLYIGGDFKGLLGQPITNLAKWNGTQWAPIGGGVSGPLGVRALQFKDGKLYVGGGFTNAGGIKVSQIAVWDGATWDDCAGGVAPKRLGFNPGVNALHWVGEKLFVGGSFTNAGGVAATNIASYSNGSWQSLGSGPANGVTGDGFEVVNAITSDDGGNVIVGGSFLKAGSISAPLVANWARDHWERLGAGLDRPSQGYVSAFQTYNGGLYAAGFFTTINGVYNPSEGGLARWDGANWFPTGVPIGIDAITSLASDGQTLYVGGSVGGAAPRPNRVADLLTFDGSRWAMFSNGLDPTTSVLVKGIVVGTNVVVGGRLANSAAQNLLKWDGIAWQPASPAVQTPMSGSPDVRFNDFIDFNGKILAVGTFLAGGGKFLNGVGITDGFSWQPLGDGLPAGGFSVAHFGADIVVGHRDGVSRWDGNQWSSLGTIFGSVLALCPDGESLYAGGDFTSGQATNIAQWRGGAWVPLGGTINGPVFVLRMVNHELYAGGSFSEANGHKAWNLAKWTGTDWVEVGGGLSGGSFQTGVWAIEPDEADGIYVGGDFVVGGPADEQAFRIARWNGNTWERLGSGVNGSVNGLALKQRDLFVFGNVFSAGGHPSAHVARWRIPTLSLEAISPTNDGFSLKARGLPGASFILQRSRDLIQWENVSTNQLVEPTLNLVPDRSPEVSSFRVLETN